MSSGKGRQVVGRKSTDSSLDPALKDRDCAELPVHGGTKGDYSPVLFDRDVKPYLPLLADALGYGCVVQKMLLEFKTHFNPLSQFPNGYDVLSKEEAMLFHLRKKEESEVLRSLYTKIT